MKIIKPIIILFLLFVTMTALVLGFWYFRISNTSKRTTKVMSWLRNPIKTTAWSVKAGERCGNAPFSLPTDGLIGFLWDDSFRPGHRHQGIDIFGGTQPGITPVIAAYPGYVTRLRDWKSSLILRIPSDPLQPDRQIWTYYTHLADAQGASLISAQFPPGISEVYVERGTLLGYQGNFSGKPGVPVGVHLHFSIVLDDNKSQVGTNTFLNELDIRNTLDPSAYLGLPLNGKLNPGEIPVCKG